MASVNELFDKAQKLLHKGRLSDADSLFEKIVKQMPDAIDALNMRGIIHARQGHMAQAGQFFSEALKFQPEHPAANENLGRILIDAGRPADAMRHFETAAQRNPRSYMALFGKGCASMQLGDDETSIACFDQAARIDPGQVLLYVNRGNVYLRNSHHTTAEADFRQALSLNPQQPQALAGLGRCLSHRGDYAEAIESFEKAQAAGVQDIGTGLDLAEALEQNGDREAAYRLYRTLSEEHPDSLNVYTRFDQLLLRSGSAEKQRLLERISEDRIYDNWQQAIDVARELTSLFNYHDVDTLTRVDRFLAQYQPGELHDREWWREQLSVFDGGHDKLLRSIHSAVFCWSLPDRSTLTEIAGFIGSTRMHSYGAGTGVWERLLRDHFGTDIRATDYNLRHRFIEMSFEDYSTAKVDPDEALFISWIVRDDTSILNIFDQVSSGQKLVLVGEPADASGKPTICASHEIFERLERDYTLVRSIPLVSYSLLNDTVNLYTRN